MLIDRLDNLWREIKTYEKKSEELNKKIKEAEEMFDIHIDLVNEMHMARLTELRADKEILDDKFKEFISYEIMMANLDIAADENTKL